MSKKLLFENISREELLNNMRKLYMYMKKKLPKINIDPKVFLKEDSRNADDILGKTGYYDPENNEIHLYVTDRHAKDILRSFAHELIHHEQNCSGMTKNLDMSKTHMIDYASHDEGLRKAERDAFKRGNMLFRYWTDKLKANRDKETRVMNEKKTHYKTVQKAHEIGKEVEKAGGAEEPYAVGMDIAKKKAAKIKSKKNEVEMAKEEGKKAARRWLNHDQGKDLKAMKNSPQPQKENKDNSNNTPYPELFEKKERVMQDAFDKREELIFQELLKRAIEQK